ncbi:MAG: zinc ribbon domain-containing protein [Acidiferrobacterales bacterium]
MPSCNYCGHNVSFSAEVCPKCGEVSVRPGGGQWPGQISLLFRGFAWIPFSPCVRFR